MEENFLSKKEEQKSIPSIYVDTNNKNNLHTTNNTLYKTRQTYSKRINTNNMKKLTKIFSRDRILLEVANDPGYKNLKTLNKKNNDNINENITEKEKKIIKKKKSLNPKVEVKAKKIIRIKLKKFLLMIKQKKFLNY